jgi:adenine deaminase
MGMIAPGRWADVVLVKDLKNFKADLVIAKGQVIAEKVESGKSACRSSVIPAWVTNSVKLKKPLKAEDFKLKVKGEKLKVKANVIGVIENQAPTKHLTFDLQPSTARSRQTSQRDIAKIALVERHKGTGRHHDGAGQRVWLHSEVRVASTVAHDSHHMIVVGTDEESMAVAGQQPGRSGGGQVVVKNGKVIGQVELKIAGLMSTEKADVVAKKQKPS